MPGQSKLKPEDAKEKILEAAERILRDRGAQAATTEAVSSLAKCSKGLIYHHFKNKGTLIAATAERIADGREALWGRALSHDDPSQIIHETWQLLAAEARNGTVRAWASLMWAHDPNTQRTVGELTGQFGRFLASSVEAVLSSLGLTPVVPACELGWLLASVIHGAEVQLAAGAEPNEVEGAYAAAWLGVLSMARPLSRPG